MYLLSQLKTAGKSDFVYFTNEPAGTSEEPTYCIEFTLNHWNTAEGLLTSSANDFVEYVKGVITCSDLSKNDIAINSMRLGEADDNESEGGDDDANCPLSIQNCVVRS